MAIQINGTTVVDNSRQITNVNGYYGPGVATQAEAESGTNNDQLMTPLRVKQAIDAGGGSVINRIQRGSTAFSNNNVNASITSVDTGKAFVSSSCRGTILRGSPQYSDGDYTATGSGSAQLTASTTIQIRAGVGLPYAPYQYTGIANAGTVDWEVIEFT
jgi:hypothetical protein